jgi:hypothetical protein
LAAIEACGSNISANLAGVPHWEGGLADFMQAFRLDETGESVFRAGARRLGLPP